MFFAFYFQGVFRFLFRGTSVFGVVSIYLWNAFLVMSSNIFVSRDTENILKVVTSSTSYSSSGTKSSKSKANVDRANSVSLRKHSYDGQNGSDFAGSCQFSMSDLYNDMTDELKPEGTIDYRHHGSEDSGMTTSSLDSGASAYSSLNSTEGKNLKKLPRQMAIDVDDYNYGPDRSVSVDSGFTDFSTEGSSNDLKLAKKMTKAWIRRAEFRRKIEDSSDIPEAVKRKIEYVSLFGDLKCLNSISKLSLKLSKRADFSDGIFKSCYHIFKGAM